MFVRLTVLTDADVGKRLELRPGQQARVGRSAAMNELSVGDEFMAPVHLAVVVEEKSCTLTDLSGPLRKHPRCAAQCFVEELRNAPCPASLCRVHDMSGENGVYVNGVQLKEAQLADGDVVVAGTSAIQVTLGGQPLPAVAEEEPPPPPEPRLLLTPEEQERALAFLQRLTTDLTKDGTPLFAIVDAARDPRILPLIRSHDVIRYSLYDGPEGEKLDDIAPHLVELPPGSRLTELLVREHWGQARFTFVFSQFPFKDLRRHLRRFLMVEDEGGKEMFFRFYDPRVLRVYLPTCTPEEAALFLGPVSYFLPESDEHGQAWALSYQHGALRVDRVHF